MAYVFSANTFQQSCKILLHYIHDYILEWNSTNTHWGRASYNFPGNSILKILALEWLQNQTLSFMFLEISKFGKSLLNLPQCASERFWNEETKLESLAGVFKESYSPLFSACHQLFSASFWQ